MRSSIQSRLIVSASFVLICFLGLAGLVLDAAYLKGTQNALNEQLQIHLYSILAKSELSKNNQIAITSGLSDPRFSRIDSGLYAFVFNDENTIVWRSASSAGVKTSSVPSLKAGQKTFIQTTHMGQANVELHYKAIIENAFGTSSPFEFVMISSSNNADTKIAGFRSVLWQWLGGISLLLISVQFFIIRKSLAPLRQIVVDLEFIHQGSSDRLKSQYTSELKDIASTLNRLIENERTHLIRYRNTLADLAHSLKTPLSVLTGLYEQGSLSKEDITTLKTQTLQMRQLVDYQLQKAAAKGHQTLSAPLNLQPIVQQITNSLNKVYVTKQLTLLTDIDEDIKYSAEKGDMFELFGNLLDNAFKWANKTVRISIIKTDDGTSSGVQITIEDDGPGIADEELSNVLKRGIRADETTKGHGIGLAVANELVSLYQGSFISSNSPLGGQQWTIFLPYR